MDRYRKRPVVVEAVRWTGDNEAEIQAWVGAAYFNALDAEDRENADDPEHTAQLLVRANSVWVGMKTGEWVLQDKLGAYPCADSVFTQNYEEE